MEQLDKIIRYLDGEMLNKEKLLFDQELQTNDDLQQTLIIAQEVNHTISDEKLISFLETLKHTQSVINNELSTGIIAHDQSKENVNPKTIMLYPWKYIAAASIIVFVMVFMYINYSKPSSDKLFTDYYKRYEANLLTRSASPSEVNELIRAIQFYDKGDYYIAIAQFGNIIKKDATNTAAYFFIGVSYIETKNYGKAIENLKYVINQNDTAFIEHAEWYLALCYIKTHQTKEATLILKKIANSNTFYKLPANDLLRNIK